MYTEIPKQTIHNYFRSLHFYQNVVFLSFLCLFLQLPSHRKTNDKREPSEVHKEQHHILWTSLPLIITILKVIMLLAVLFFFHKDVGSNAASPHPQDHKEEYRKSNRSACKLSKPCQDGGVDVMTTTRNKSIKASLYITAGGWGGDRERMVFT